MIEEIAARIETHATGDQEKMKKLLNEIAYLRLEMLDFGLNPEYRTVDEWR